MLGVVDPKPDNGPLLNRVCIAMLVISGVAVLARFGARRLENIKYGWDDWIILATIPPAWVFIILHMLAVSHGGFGKHMNTVEYSEIQYMFKLLYVIQVFYPLSMLMIKWSIIAFYRRVFPVRSTKLPIYIIFGTILAWWFAVTLVGIFSCNPVHAFWDRASILLRQATCIDNVQYYMGQAIPNILTDAVLLVFPMPMIWQLHLPKSQKLSLIGIFSLGGFIIVISSLRLATIVENQKGMDQTYTLAPLGIFNVVEVAIAILLACLPSFRPLLRFTQCKSVRMTRKNTSPAEPGELSGDTLKNSAKTYWKSSKKVGITEIGDDASFRKLKSNQQDPSEDRITVVDLEQGYGKSRPLVAGQSRDMELKEMHSGVNWHV